jgi:thiamine-monophosphate kinase
VSDELARIELLRGIFAASAEGSGVRVGIGDDAAVLEGGLVWTIDAQVEDVHFRRAWLAWEDVGYRSFMAAASDLAAMGATPVAALSALALSGAITDEALSALARGQAEAARAVGAPIAGGNLAAGATTSVTTTLLGRADRPMLRSGARAGDTVLVAGALGLAAAGLSALMQDARDKLQDARIAPALEAWRRPRARIDDGLAAARGGATAAIDVSDGLARDASLVAVASNVTIALDGAAILAHGGRALAGAAAAIGRDPLDLALHGGEDYAVVVTADAPLPGFTPIGRVEPRGRDVLVLVEGGVARPLEPRGFDHFR